MREVVGGLRKLCEPLFADLLAALGVALDCALGLTSLRSSVCGKAVGRRAFANLANPRMLIFSVLRLRVQRLICIFAALGEQRALGLAGLFYPSLVWTAAL